MANCVSTIAGNIGLDCDNPLEGGYSGRGILIPLESLPTFTQNANNPRIIEAISIAEGAHVCSVDNVGSAPFDGSSTTGTGDAGYPKFNKAIALRVLARGAEASRDVVEPLIKSGRGFVGIFEKNDHVGDGSFEVIGFLQPMKCTDPSTVSRQETANSGAWNVTLQCTEAWAECTLFSTDYATTLALFEDLLESAF